MVPVTTWEIPTQLLVPRYLESEPVDERSLKKERDREREREKRGMEGKKFKNILKVD